MSSDAASPSRKQPRREDRDVDPTAEASAEPGSKRVKTTHNDGASAATTAASSPPAAASTDLRSILRQAAAERAQRAGKSAPTSAAAPPIRPAHAPPNLRLEISSPPHGRGVSADISTPVLYTGPSSGLHPSPLHRGSSGASAAMSPIEEFAGFVPRGALPTYQPAATSTAATAASPSTTAASNGIACPLCARSFPADKIEVHASACTGQACDDVRISAIPDGDASRIESSPPAAAANAASATSAQFSIRVQQPTQPMPFFPRHHNQLKVLTWNCWFADFCMKQRMDAISSVIQAEQPHIVCLQEVTKDSLTMLLRAPWAASYYISSPPLAPLSSRAQYPDDVAGYFTLLATRFPPESSSSCGGGGGGGGGMMRLPFESVMARDLLCANISVPTSAGVRKLSIATSHLESEHRRKDARRQQLEVALKFLRRRQQDTPTAIYCGDMNLNGSECSDLVTKYGWIDAWLSLHPQRGGDRAGVTMDTRANGMLAAQPRNAKTPYQVRLDRIWIRTASGERQTSGSGAAGAALGEKSAEQAWKPNAAAKPAAAAAYGPTPMAITPTAAASSAGSSTSSAVPEWLLLSVERIGLCAIDLRQPQKYAEKNYKAFDTPASTSAQAAAAMFAPPAAAASAPMMPRQGIHGFGSLAAAAASSKEGDSAVAAPPPAGTVVFPSDHFGLLAILQVNEQE